MHKNLIDISIDYWINIRAGPCLVSSVGTTVSYAGDERPMFIAQVRWSPGEYDLTVVGRKTEV